jgi:hypothetical protein
MLESDLDKVEEERRLDLGRDLGLDADKDEEYYPQFPEAIRLEAGAMSDHYELFYCLEKSIRSLLEEKLKAEHGANWWTALVPDHVQQNAEKAARSELDAGFTQRSSNEIDYTSFGELGEIVRKNWSSFDDTFRSNKAFNKIMTALNILRGPIAHCCPLAEDEVARLRLTLRDWFRLMA